MREPNTNHFEKQSKTQAAAILRLLVEARGAWVPLPEILALGIAQYNSRIFELRRRGFKIENRIEVVNEVRHSWFRIASPSPDMKETTARVERDDFYEERGSDSADWFTRETGKKRPVVAPETLFLWERR
jgi:hypothetical protein